MDIIISLEFTLFVSALSVLSGIGSYLQSRREKRRAGGLLDFITDITLALVVGLSVAYFGNYQKWHEGLICFLVLLLSNNGADALSLMKQRAVKIITNDYKSK